MSQLVAEFFAFPDFVCCFPDDPSREVDYMDPADPANPFRKRHFIMAVPLGSAPSLAAMRLEWTAVFGDRPFSFRSTCAAPSPPEESMWNRHVVSQIDPSLFDGVVFKDVLGKWPASRDDPPPAFRYVFVQLKAADECQFRIWLQYAAAMNGSCNRDMLGFSFGESPVV